MAAMSADAERPPLRCHGGDGVTARSEPDEVAKLRTELDRSQAEVAELRRQLEESRQQTETLLRSTSWRLLAPLRTSVRWLRASLPLARRLIGASPSRTFQIELSAYARWLRQYSVIDHEARAHLAARAAALQATPLISVVMPAYNIDPAILSAAIESVRRQIYPDWELCVADDASTLGGVRECLKAAAAADPRIKVAFRTENGNICAASNTALELATGDYVVLLDADDLLAEDALFWVADAIASHPDVDLIFSDEDKLDGEGRRFDPHFKSAWNPALMLSQNAFSHLGVFRRALIERVGRFRVGYEGAQDHDLVLRCADATSPDRIRHIPRVLYHWRVSPDSTASSLSSKPFAWDAGRRAIEDHLQRRGLKAQVSRAHHGYYQVSYRLPAPPPLVSIIVPSAFSNRGTLNWLASILSRTSYPRFELILLATEPHLAAIRGNKDFEALRADARLRTCAHDVTPFNYSAVNNLGAARASGQLLCFLNDDIEIGTPDWLSELVARVHLEGVAGAGPLLHYPSGSVQYAGILLGVGGVADHAFRNMERGHVGYFARGVLEQDYTALTAACLVMRREVFEAVDGFDTALPAAFNDIDLCLRIRRLGWRLVWTPAAALTHHESLTFGPPTTAERRAQFEHDRALMRSRWEAVLESDPCYNPNLSLDPPRQFDLAFPPRLPVPPDYLARGRLNANARTATLPSK
jgi:GT2 family glycosyltransferase